MAIASSKEAPIIKKCSPLRVPGDSDLDSLKVFNELTRGSVGLFLDLCIIVILDLLFPVEAAALVDFFDEALFAATDLDFELLFFLPFCVTDVLVFALVDLVVFAM